MSQKGRRPSRQHWDNSECQSLVSLRSSEGSKLHTPVQSTQEGQDDGSVCNLDSLQVVQSGQCRGQINSCQSIPAFKVENDQILAEVLAMLRTSLHTSLSGSSFSSHEDDTSGCSDVRDRSKRSKVEDVVRNRLGEVPGNRELDSAEQVKVSHSQLFLGPPRRKCLRNHQTSGYGREAILELQRQRLEGTVQRSSRRNP